MTIRLPPEAQDHSSSYQVYRKLIVVHLPKVLGASSLLQSVRIWSSTADFEISDTICIMIKEKTRMISTVLLLLVFTCMPGNNRVRQKWRREPQPEIKGRHHYGPWLWSGCSPETQASGGARGTCLGKHFWNSAIEKPPCKETLLWVFRTTSARICILPKRMFSPFAFCCSGQDVYVQTVLISSWGRKVVVSKRVASLLPSFPALCSLATGPGRSSCYPIKSQSLDK